MLTCSRFVAGLNDYLDDSVDAAIRARFDHHIEVCPRCRIVAETTRKTIALYKVTLPYEVPPALEARLMAAIRSRRI
jgi:anti-sigma factor RsiW